MAVSQQNYLQNKSARPDLIYELLFVIPWARRLNMLTRDTEDIKKKKNPNQTCRDRNYNV